jgi:hypothetical protein
MSEFLRSIAVDSTTPVQYACYHPVADNRLRHGKPAEPTCLAVDYEYEHPIVEIFNALGFQGGTIHQAVEEIKRLKAIVATAAKGGQ